MAVRNFYIKANIDGRTSTLSGGPAGKGGGFSMTVYIRDKGNIRTALLVSGMARSDGSLVLEVEPRIEATSTEYGSLVLATER